MAALAIVGMCLGLGVPGGVLQPDTVKELSLHVKELKEQLKVKIEEHSLKQEAAALESEISMVDSPVPASMAEVAHSGGLLLADALSDHVTTESVAKAGSCALDICGICTCTYSSPRLSSASCPSIMAAFKQLYTPTTCARQIPQAVTLNEAQCMQVSSMSQDAARAQGLSISCTASSSSPGGSSGGGSSSCFAKSSTTACRVSEPTLSPDDAYAICYSSKSRAVAVGTSTGKPAERMLMADLEVGDLVLTSHGAGGLALTRILAKQHANAETTAPMLTLHTADGASLSLTPDHAIYINGQLAPAADATVGALLTNARGEAVAIKRIVAIADAAVINPVTGSGTILAADRGTPFLAASHPMWIAPLLLSSLTARIVANGAIILAGDAVGAAPFVGALLTKIAATVALAALVKRLGKSSRLSQ
jgi:hypothetical protein